MPAGNLPKFTEEELIETVKLCKGNLAKVAQTLKVTRQTIYNYVKAYPAVKQTFTDEREALLDNVEHVLFDAALEGQRWAVEFLLRTKAKDRGYTERVEKRTLNVNVDFSKLTDEQLQLIAQGVDPQEVLRLSDSSEAMTIDGEYTVDEF